LKNNYSKSIYIAAFGIAFPIYAYAYLDPGTGSIVIQAVIAAVVTLGIYLRQIRVFLRGLFSRKQEAKPPKSDAPASPRPDDGASH
jgi:hypothetical protein